MSRNANTRFFPLPNGQDIVGAFAWGTNCRREGGGGAGGAGPADLSGRVGIRSGEGREDGCIIKRMMGGDRLTDCCEARDERRDTAEEGREWRQESCGAA